MKNYDSRIFSGIFNIIKLTSRRQDCSLLRYGAPATLLDTGVDSSDQR